MNPFKKIKTLLRRIERRIHNHPDVESLVQMGMKVGRDVHIEHRVLFDVSHCWLISIGDEVTLAPRVHILAHDASTKRHLGYSKIGRVSIGRKTFIGEGTIILPGVTIGENVIIGAGSVVSNDIPDGSVAVGNPSKVVAITEEYIEKHRELMKTRPVFSSRGYTIDGGITFENKQKMLDALKDGIGYVQ
jgi:maltose O-acetyltransferase